MHDIFRRHVEALEPSFRTLIGSEPFTFRSLPKRLPKAGVYVFFETGDPLYVGRTNRVRDRLQEHCRPGSRHSSAPFAFRLAREARGLLAASYKPEGSRAHLVTDPAFSLAFSDAKSRLCSMQIRVVEESDPLRQALLEIYVAVSLQTPYNDFDNH